MHIYRATKAAGSPLMCDNINAKCLQIPAWQNSVFKFNALGKKKEKKIDLTFNYQKSTFSKQKWFFCSDLCTICSTHKSMCVCVCGCLHGFFMCTAFACLCEIWRALRGPSGAGRWGEKKWVTVLREAEAHQSGSAHVASEPPCVCTPAHTHTERETRCRQHSNRGEFTSAF